MGDAVVRDIRSKSASLLQGIRRTIRAMDDETLAKPSSGWQLWKQCYHLLYWLDHWFVDPLSFAPPSFHQSDFMDPGIVSPIGLCKGQLLEYLGLIECRIEHYLGELSAEELQRQYEVRGRIRSRLDMILGQFSHVSHHIGYICATVRAVTGKSIWEDESRG